MERGQGDSWRSQSLEVLHGCPLLHKEYKDLMVMMMMIISDVDFVLLRNVPMQLQTFRPAI
jgi:hypothetical protein